jgi:hypothetical protein
MEHKEELQNLKLKLAYWEDALDRVKRWASSRERNIKDRIKNLKEQIASFD